MLAAGSRIAALFSAAGPCVVHSGTDGAWERENGVRIPGRLCCEPRLPRCPGPACGGACGVIRCRRDSVFAAFGVRGCRYGLGLAFKCDIGYRRDSR